jgi:hypothetical protein
VRVVHARPATGRGTPSLQYAPDLNRGDDVESHNVLGTLWAAFGMTAYYMALVWINTLLGMFLTPLFLIPLTWLQDRVAARGRRAEPAPAR